MCNRCLKQTATSLNSCAAALYGASACEEELFGLAELFKELHYKFSVRLEVDFDSARHTLQGRGPQGLMHIEIRCLAIQQWIREERLSFGRVDTKNNTAHLFTIFWWDHERSRHPRNFGYISLESRTTESLVDRMYTT